MSSSKLKRVKKSLARCATEYIACSAEAAEFLFGERLLEEGKARVIINSVDVRQFLYNSSARVALRQKLALKPTTIVLGAIARLEEQKNHLFMVEIMRELKAKGDRWRLVLVGSGSLAGAIRSRSEELGVGENVMMVGETGDVRSFLSAFDLLLMPSLYEGLSLAAIEAQAAGLPVLASENRVPRAVACTDLVHFLPLEDSAAAWANWIANFSPAPRREGKLPEGRWAEGYDIASAAPRLVARYEAMIQQA